MKKLISLCLIGLALSAKGLCKDLPVDEHPKLVVTLVVDQMRWDYLTRFADRYGEGGFRRLMGEGYNCNRTTINYLPAITAVGHTSIGTGSVPALTGIVGNGFYVDGHWTYCTGDNSVKSIGTDDPETSTGKQSPHWLLCYTLGDELRLATNFRAKTIGIALKDRAAILTTGHAANAAYWLDGKSMRFITSSYYMDQLPQWAQDFNARHLGQQYMDSLLTDTRQCRWPLLYPEDTYVQSAPDGQVWEDDMWRSLEYSPWGQTITFDMAKAAVLGEQLGNNPADVPDLLVVSISTTDKVGHQLSPNSIWMEDLFLRLDHDIADFLSFLDEQVGEGQYLLVLSADHAGMHNTKFMQDHHLPASAWKAELIRQQLDSLLSERFPNEQRPFIRDMGNLQVRFQNHILTSTAYPDILSTAINFLSKQPQIAYAFAPDDIPDYLPEPIRTYTINGFNRRRGGQIQLIYENGVMDDYSPSLDELRSPTHIRKGTTHSVWSPDDTHIPLIFFGWHVPQGWDNRTHHITDIAATLAALLNIQQPNACVGEAITFE